MNRLELRLNEMRNCTTPEELSFNIWTKQLEEAIGDRSSYRNSFTSWIHSYVSNTPPKEWSGYRTPEEVANGIWNPNLDTDDSDRLWFGSLRTELSLWIDKYKKTRNESH